MVLSGPDVAGGAGSGHAYRRLPSGVSVPTPRAAGDAWRSGSQRTDLGSLRLASWSEQEQRPGEDHVGQLVHREPDLVVLARGDRGAEREVGALALDDHPDQAAQGEAGEGEQEEHERGVAIP